MVAAGALAGCGSGSRTRIHPNADVVTRDDATAVATTLDEVEQALDAAESGDVVFVPPTATIDLTGTWIIPVPEGVTLAGGRGVRGPRGPVPGALFYTREGDESGGVGETLQKFFLQDGARITGIRLTGHHHEYVNAEIAYNSDYYAHRGGGIRVSGEGEVDNCEISGWPYAAVSLGDTAHVHHNYLHHNTWEGLGYGVAVSSDGKPVIEHNYFNYNRHAIAGEGHPDTAYVARYNVVGPDWIGHQFDMHGTEGMSGTAGSTTEIRHNTFQATRALEVKSRNPGGEYPAIHIRGTPTEGVWVEHNWFYHESREGAYEQTGGPHRVTFTNNHYGEDEPSDPDVGAPMSRRGGLF